MTTYRGSVSPLAGSPYEDKKFDLFTGDNSTVAFTLTSTPTLLADIEVYIHGIYQHKSTFSFSGTTLTFSTAPPTATSNIEVTYRI